VLQACFDLVNSLLTMHIHLACGAGARWSNGMSGYEVQADANLLSAFALMIGGALGVALPMDHSDHLDLFLTALRHRGAAALLLFALTSPAYSVDV
jgi:hypothetical protein